MMPSGILPTVMGHSTGHTPCMNKAPSKFSGARFREVPDPFLPVWQIGLRGVGFAGCETAFELLLPRIP